MGNTSRACQSSTERPPPPAEWRVAKFSAKAMYPVFRNAQNYRHPMPPVFRGAQNCRQPMSGHFAPAKKCRHRMRMTSALAKKCRHRMRMTSALAKKCRHRMRMTSALAKKCRHRMRMTSALTKSTGSGCRRLPRLQRSGNSGCGRLPRSQRAGAADAGDFRAGCQRDPWPGSQGERVCPGSSISPDCSRSRRKPAGSAGVPPADCRRQSIRPITADRPARLSQSLLIGRWHDVRGH